MFLILVAFLLAAEAAKLDNAYLPPTNAKESGGSDGALQVPLEPPYIDPYSPQGTQQPTPHSVRPDSRSFLNKRKNLKPVADEQTLENEDEVVVPTPQVGKGRFISGSYSYTGPDNVLVTVTYKANDRDGRKNEESEEAEEDYDNNESNENEEETGRGIAVNVEEEEEQQVAAEEEDDAIPTPPSLPAELARAFDFHRRKQQQLEDQEEKTQKPIKGKKPLHNIHNKKKGTHAPQYPQGQGHGKFGNKLNPSHGGHSGYHYAPQNNYVPPTIHQGYSYPKHN